DIPPIVSGDSHRQIEQRIRYKRRRWLADDLIQRRFHHREMGKYLRTDGTLLLRFLFQDVAKRKNTGRIVDKNVEAAQRIQNAPHRMARELFILDIFFAAATD